MEEMIRFIILKNLEELDNYDSLDGLCFYFANNIKADLEMMEISVSMHNIEGAHYYLLVGEEYLIDPTYVQFLPKEGEKAIMFEDFPANILEKTDRGREILGDLLYNGYHKLEGNDMDIYLASFKLKEKRFK